MLLLVAKGTQARSPAALPDSSPHSCFPSHSPPFQFYFSVYSKWMVYVFLNRSWADMEIGRPSPSPRRALRQPYVHKKSFLCKTPTSVASLSSIPLLAPTSEQRPCAVIQKRNPYADNPYADPLWSLSFSWNQMQRNGSAAEKILTPKKYYFQLPAHPVFFPQLSIT